MKNVIIIGGVDNLSLCEESLLMKLSERINQISTTIITPDELKKLSAEAGMAINELANQLDAKIIQLERDSYLTTTLEVLYPYIHTGLDDIKLMDRDNRPFYQKIGHKGGNKRRYPKAR